MIISILDEYATNCPGRNCEMKLERLTKTILICAIVVGGVVMLSACSKKSTETTKSVPADTTTATAAATTTTTAAPTPSIPAISGPLESNEVTSTWVETAIDPAAIMYVNLESNYLNVRKGPGTDFEQVGALTDGMSVTVVAKTDTNWYKLQDGYYVSGDFLTDTP